MQKREWRTKTTTLDKYIKSQKHHKDAIEEEEKRRTNERKKCNEQNKKETEITDLQETKEHIANYFEDLYQARPGAPEYEESTRHINYETQNGIQARKQWKTNNRKRNAKHNKKAKKK